MSKGGTKTRLPAGLDALSLIQANAARLSGTGRKELFQQVTEALRTGGAPGARIPLIQQSIEASKQAEQVELRDVREDLQRRNISGPFASRELAETRQAGEQATASIGPRIAEQLISGAPNTLNMIPGGSLASGSATTTTPDTATPAIGAGAAVVGAVIAAI
jgi:hypothetical protein